MQDFPVHTNLGVNQNYLTQKFVFPPGGCLQRIDYNSSTLPSGRFEHAQAMDTDQAAMLVYGGCRAPSTFPAVIQTSGATTGDPTTNCNSSNSLLNDTWMYLPPTTVEVAHKDQTVISTNHPYSATDLIRLPNIFGTDFWLDKLALFDDSSFKTQKTSPRPDEVLGKWIQLSPSTVPTRRVSASIYFDRNKHKFYLFGGQGCIDAACSSVTTLNDLWEFTPPSLASECDRESGACTNQGSWRQVQANNTSPVDMPRARKGALLAFGQPQFSYGDQYYTVTDSPCIGQGPILTGDSSVSKQLVGAIYVDIDRSEFGTSENLLINLRMLPFDTNTKLPGWFNSGTPFTRNDDRDQASGQDQAVIRVQLLNSFAKTAAEIESLPQPRFHNFIAGTPILGEQFVYVSGGSGQITEKQVFVPLTSNESIDLIKIERVQGSVKFYELTVSKF